MKPWLKRAGKYKIERINVPRPGVAVDLRVPRKGVLHTTEGGWDGSLSVFRKHYAPTFMVGAGRIAQFVPLGEIAAALEHPQGTPPTNGHAVVQIEIVGNSKHSLWQPEPATLDTLAELLATLKQEAGIPLIRGGNGSRSLRRWQHNSGWFGHADVPHNEHWDPGNLNYEHVLGLARKKLAARNNTKRAKTKRVAKKVVRKLRPRSPF